MLHLLLGRAGAGKSETIFSRLCLRGQDRPQLLIVPEQYSHETERALCRRGGNRTSDFAQVLSFTRLANRVFAQVGGLARPVLDGGGRLLLMHMALQSVSSQLRVYARPSRRAAFLQELIATADEVKSYCVSPAGLIAAGEETGEEGDRLRDLGLILAAYEAVTARQASDPRDRLTRLAQALEQEACLAGQDIWLDGFTDFTPQERLVVRQLLTQGEQVTVALTCDGLEAGLPVFDAARRTALSLLALARDCGVEAEVEHLSGRPSRPAALKHLEEQLFGEPARPFSGDAPEIELYEAASPYAEAEWAAARILRLVREEGCRFRDIGVTARSMEGYADVVEAVFARYGVPLFLSRMTDILQKPVLTLLTAALDSVAGGYEYDDLFRYLKTGLAGVTAEECDLLENYVLRWDIRGSRWTEEKDWSLHPGGYSLPWTQEDRTLVARLDQLRRQVIRPLEALRSVRRGTGRTLAMAVYDFLEAIGLPRRLEERAGQLTRRGRLAMAEEYAQLWDILTGALEACADLLTDELELEEFAQLFQLVLSQYDVGSIPVSLDRVTAGDAPRMIHRQCRYLLILGANDDAFPLITRSPGLLSDDDRALLALRGLELAPSADRRLDREMTIVYDICTLPRQGLLVSWPAAGEEGEERRPSFLINRLRLLFPGRTEGAPRTEPALFSLRPALEWAGRNRDFALLERLGQWSRERGQADCAAGVARMEQAARLRRGSLSPEAVQALYGRRVRLSASRMDKLNSCHFSYFMQYGLKAKPRTPAGFDAPEAGTFVHYVLEHVLRRDGGEGLEGEARRAAVRQAVEQYVEQELGGLEDKTPRFRYLFRRLLRSVDLVVDNVLEELACSDFKPISFELGFGEKGELPPVEYTAEGVTLSISGFVDRVDGWVHGDRLYLRVVDYKTGHKSFDLTDIWHGLGMQMLLYLFTLEAEGQPLYGRELVSAGVLYLPAHDVIVRGSRRMEEAERRRAVDRDLVRKGLVLNDPEVLEAMEHLGPEGPRFLPVKVSKKTGQITGDALATAEQLGKLRRHIDKVLRDISRELARGNIDADPYYKNARQSACAFCEYAAACHFEEGRGGDCRRYLYAVKGTRFWEGVGEE